MRKITFSALFIAALIAIPLSVWLGRNRLSQIISGYWPTLIKNNQSLSPDILDLTQPVFSFNGIIETADRNTITLTTSFSPSKKLTYQVVLDSLTKLSRQSSMPIPYLFTEHPPATGSAQPVTSDLKLGQFITITSKTDLRTSPQRKFVASAVILPPVSTSFGGIIAEIKGNRLTVKNMLTPPLVTSEVQTAPQEQTLTVAVTQETEISGLIFASDPQKPPRPQQYSLSDLKVGQNISVYTSDQVTPDSLIKALKVDPAIAPR